MQPSSYGFQFGAVAMLVGEGKIWSSWELDVADLARPFENGIEIKAGQRFADVL